MTTETSKQSYRQLKDLGSRQLAVHRALGDLGIASNRDIARYLNKIPSDVTPRMKELRDYGFVAEHGKKRDPETGRNVSTWCVTDPFAQKKIDLVRDPTEEIKWDKWEPSKAVSWEPGKAIPWLAEEA